MTVTEFAKEMGLTKRAVQVGIKAGRLNAVKNDRGYYIIGEFAASKKEWEAKTFNKNNQKIKSKAPVETEKPEFDFDASRAKKAAYDAKLAELEFKRKSGEVIPVAKVESDAFEVYRAHRDKLLSLPSKWAYKMASEQDVHACEIYLNQELTDALQELVDAFKRK